MRALGLFTEPAPVLQGTSPKKAWYPLSVADSIFLGQVPKIIGHFWTFQWTGLLKAGPVVKLQHKIPCNPVTLYRDLRTIVRDRRFAQTWVLKSEDRVNFKLVLAVPFQAQPSGLWCLRVLPNSGCCVSCARVFGGSHDPARMEERFFKWVLFVLYNWRSSPFLS